MFRKIDLDNVGSEISISKPGGLAVTLPRNYAEYMEVKDKGKNLLKMFCAIDLDTKEKFLVIKSNKPTEIFVTPTLPVRELVDTPIICAVNTGKIAQVEAGIEISKASIVPAEKPAIAVFTTPPVPSKVEIPKKNATLIEC